MKTFLQNDGCKRLKISNFFQFGKYFIKHICDHLEKVLETSRLRNADLGCRGIKKSRSLLFQLKQIHEPELKSNFLVQQRSRNQNIDSRHSRHTKEYGSVCHLSSVAAIRPTFSLFGKQATLSSQKFYSCSVKQRSS